MTTATLQLHSDAFMNGDLIPQEYTCDGDDQSPPLSWDELPNGTQSLAIVMHDPDAPDGDFTHWVLFNLPGQDRALEAGVPAEAQLPNGARQGQNDFGRIGYGGPCPPPGRPHRYVLELTALDAPLDLPASTTRQHVEDAMRGHVFARGELVGGYRRQG